MSQENLEIVRQPLGVGAGASLQRLGLPLLRFPSLLTFVMQWVGRLPPASRLRRALLRGGIQIGTEALNRGQPERAFSVYHPTDSELVVGERFVGLAMEGSRGREGRIRFQRAWNAEWGDFRFEPGQLIDLGDHRLLVIGRINGTGRVSGAGFDGDWAALLTVAGGWIVKEQVFWDHAEALDAVGLSEKDARADS